MAKHLKNNGNSMYRACCLLFLTMVLSTGCISTRKVAGYKNMDRAKVIRALNDAIAGMNGGSADEKGILIRREEATHQRYDPSTQTTTIYGRVWEEFFPYNAINEVSMQTSPLGLVGLGLIDPTMISAPVIKTSKPTSALNQDGQVLIQPKGILRIYFPFYLFKPQYFRAKSCARLLETARTMEQLEKKPEGSQ